MNPSINPILEVKNLSMHFPIMGGLWRKQIASVKAVQNVSFELKQGETLGIVGESGCGKTSLGRTLVRLYKPTQGTIKFEGNDITTKSISDLKPMRRDFQMIFQDPYASLNPRLSIQEILEEPLLLHKWSPDGKFTGSHFKQREVWMKELLNLVGLRPDSLYRFPHEFSGGQRQRISIARALTLSPKLIIADEPVSALDVSIQSQILNLLLTLQNDLGLTYIFISHDLSVIRHMCDRVAVMYLGHVVELASCEELFDHPKHPYTQALLKSIPKPNPHQIQLDDKLLTGDVPSPTNPPPGCPFHNRCPNILESLCMKEMPELKSLSLDHSLACFNPN